MSYRASYRGGKASYWGWPFFVIAIIFLITTSVADKHQREEDWDRYIHRTEHRHDR